MHRFEFVLTHDRDVAAPSYPRQPIIDPLMIDHLRCP